MRTTSTAVALGLGLLLVAAACSTFSTAETAPSPPEDASAEAAPVDAGPSDACAPESCGLCDRTCGAGIACVDGVCEPTSVLTVDGGLGVFRYAENRAAWITASNAAEVLPSVTPLGSAKTVPPDDVVGPSLLDLALRGDRVVLRGKFAGDQGWVAIADVPTGTRSARGSFGPMPKTMALLDEQGTVATAIPNGAGSRLRSCAGSCGDLGVGSWAELATVDVDVTALVAGPSVLAWIGTTSAGAGALEVCAASACSTSKVRVVDAIAAPTALAQFGGRLFVGTASGTVTSVDPATSTKIDVASSLGAIDALAVTTRALYAYVRGPARLLGCRFDTTGRCGAPYVVFDGALVGFGADDDAVFAATADGRVIRATP